MSEPRFTPGPWRWEVSTNNHDAYLYQPRGMQPVVMQFGRWGFKDAAPLFRDPVHGFMRRVEQYAVQRQDNHVGFDQWINHPDAILIQTAPELYAALEELTECLSGNADSMANLRNAHAKALEALAKANGTTREGDGEQK